MKLPVDELSWLAWIAEAFIRSPSKKFFRDHLKAILSSLGGLSPTMLKRIEVMSKLNNKLSIKDRRDDLKLKQIVDSSGAVEAIRWACANMVKNERR